MSDRLLICANAPNQPTLSANTTIAELLVQPGATLTIANQVTLSVAGNIDVEGEIGGPGTVGMTGTGTIRGLLPHFQITGSGRTSLAGEAIVQGDLRVIGGNAKLLMKNDTDRLEVRGNANFGGTMSTTAGEFDVSAGTLLVGGDLRVTNTYSYRPGGTHTTVFNGTQEQTLHIAYTSGTSYSFLHNVQISNRAGLKGTLFVVTGQLSMVGEGVLTAADIYYWSVLPQTSSGYKVTRTRLGQPLRLVGNLEIPNAGTVIVENNGQLRPDGYTLKIDGELQVQSGGRLFMDKAADRLEVLGNATFSASMSSTAEQFDLSAGTLLVGGDLRVTNTYSYRPGGTHTTVFNGTQEQTLHIAYTSGTSYNFLHNVQISNRAGLKGTLFVVTGQLSMVGEGVLTAADIYYWSVLPQTSSGYKVTRTRLGQPLRLVGNLEIPNAGTVIVENNGQLRPDGYTLKIDGELQVQSGGRLFMDKAADRLEVLGNATFSASMSSTAEQFDLSAGTLLVGGDLRVTNTYSYRPGGTHTTVFNGTQEQTLHIAYTSGTSYNFLHNVQISNRAGLKGTLFVVTGQLSMVGEGVLTAADIYYWSVLPQTSSGYKVTRTRLGQPLRLVGNLEIPNAGTVIVENNGQLRPDGYTLKIDGELQVQSGGRLFMDKAADRLEVLGNATFSASMSSTAEQFDLSAGTLLVGGDLRVTNTYSYRPGGTHTTVFNGTQEQTLHIAYTSGTSYSFLHNVVVENSAGVRTTTAHIVGVLEVTVGSKLVVASGTTYVQQTFFLRDHSALEINGTLNCGNSMSRAKTAIISGTGSNHCYNRLLNQRAVIVRLTWKGESPYDQDAYLSGPRTNTGRFEVNKDNPSYTSATTVHARYLFDDQIGFGPTHPDTEGLEIVRIYPAAFPDAALQGADGVFRFSVHDFTNATRAGSSMLSQSRARVEVLHGFGETGTLLTAFDVPTGRTGNWWHVFEMRIDNIDPQNPKFTFTTLDQVVDTGTPDDPTPPAPTLGKMWNDPSNFSHSQPDHGLYWFRGGTDGRKSLGRNQNDEYYNPNRPTMIYVHGWQKDSWKGPRTPYEQRRESFRFGHTDTGSFASEDIISEWVQAGWNVGIFYWDRFADEDETAAPHHAEAKIWSTAGYKGMRWRKPDGSFVDGFQFSPRKTAMDLFYEAYTEALHHQAPGQEVRVVGHSLGNQMAVRMTRWLSDQVLAGNVGSNLLPRRIALLDPYWTGGGKEYSPLNGASAGQMVSQFVQDLKSRHGIVVEQYQSSLMNDFLMGDKNTELQKMTAFVRLHPNYVRLLQNPFDAVKQAHGEAIYWYFSSMKTGAFLCNEGPVEFTTMQVPSAAMRTEELRGWMNSGRSDWLEQVWGKDARSTANDCFARRQ
jgi:hypothetical protein